MAAYLEGSLRLLCIGRTGRAAGAEKPDLWAIQIMCLWTHLAADSRGRNIAFSGLLSNPDPVEMWIAKHTTWLPVKDSVCQTGTNKPTFSSRNTTLVVILLIIGCFETNSAVSRS